MPEIRPDTLAALELLGLMIEKGDGSARERSPDAPGWLTFFSKTHNASDHCEAVDYLVAKQRALELKWMVVDSPNLSCSYHGREAYKEYSSGKFKEPIEANQESYFSKRQKQLLNSPTIAILVLTFIIAQGAFMILNQGSDCLLKVQKFLTKSFASK